MLNRLPMTIRIEVDSTPVAGGWRAVAKVFDHRDAHYPPFSPVPSCIAGTQDMAEALAFIQLREWINRRWPHRTVPDPVRKVELRRA